MSASTKTKLAVAAATSVLGLALAGGGYVAGRNAALAGLRKRVHDFDVTQTVGGIAGEEREALAQAYDDPDRARRELDTYSWVPPNLPSPFVGVAPLPGDPPGAHINPQQFRHPTPLAIPKPEGTFRVFVTGGSTAYGSAAPGDEATITAFLQELVDRELAPETGLRYEVVNAANPAWASTHERILIENRLSELEPDLVVSLSGNNDAHFGFLGLHVLWFRTYAEHYFSLLVSEVLGLVGDGPFDPSTIWNPSIDGPVPPEEVARRLEKNLRLATTALAPTGAPYAFCLQPTLAATGKALSERERAHLAREKHGEGSSVYFRQCYEVFLERLPELDLPGLVFLDASTTFDAHGADEEIFLDSYHFGDRGNRLLAERLFELLEPLLRT